MPASAVPVCATSLPLEAQVLCCSARTHLDAPQAARLRALLRAGLDWPALLRMATQHGMLPLLAWHGTMTCADAVPLAVRQQLRTALHAQALYSQRLAAEIVRLLPLLAAQGIPALPLKGPMVATTVYGNLALRPFRDLDILVRPEDVEGTKNLLLAQGYCAPLTATQEGRYRRRKHALPLVRIDRQVTLDLHWRLTRSAFPSPLAPAHLWDCLQLGSLLGTPVWSLPPEELLLLLVVHGTTHGWSRLGWLCDIAELLRAYPGLNWQRVLDHACRRGGARMLGLSLHLAHQVLNAPLPEACRHLIQTDPVIPTLAAQVWARLFTAPSGGHDVLAGLAFFLQVRERVRDRVPILWHGLGVLRQAALASPDATQRAVRAQPPWRAWRPMLRRCLRLVRVYGLRPVTAMLRYLLGA